MSIVYKFIKLNSTLNLVDKMNQIKNKLNSTFPIHFSSSARKSAIAIIIYKKQ